MILLLALLIGVVAGLRAMTAPAGVAWGAHLGWFSISGSILSFMGSIWAAVVFLVLAVIELITDQLPTTPSRKVPMQFGARIIMGALAGATIGSDGGMLVGGLVAGVIGAVIGTYGGAAVRASMAAALGRDLPAALIEDVVAIVGAILIAVAAP